jgi:hypothetical protein
MTTPDLLQALAHGTATVRRPPRPFVVARFPGGYSVRDAAGTCWAECWDREVAEVIAAALDDYEGER